MRWDEYGHLILPRVFPYKVISDINFADEAMWCSKFKNTFIDDGDMKITTNQFWCEYLTYFVWIYFFCIVLVL